MSCHNSEIRPQTNADCAASACNMRSPPSHPPQLYKSSCPLVASAGAWVLVFGQMSAPPRLVACIWNKANFPFHQPSLFIGFWAESSQTPHSFWQHFYNKPVILEHNDNITIIIITYATLLYQQSIFLYLYCICGSRCTIKKKSQKYLGIYKSKGLGLDFSGSKRWVTDHVASFLVWASLKYNP